MAQKVILDLFVENSYHLYDITIGSARRQFVSYISLFCSMQDFAQWSWSLFLYVWLHLL